MSVSIKSWDTDQSGSGSAPSIPAACGFCAAHAERLGYANNFAIYDTDDQKSLIKDIMKRLQMDPKLYRDRAIMAAISSAKDEMIEPDQYRIDAGIDSEAAEVCGSLCGVSGRVKEKQCDGLR